jgi:hypothetical protein
MQAGNIGKQDMNKLCCKCRQEYVHVGKKYRGLEVWIKYLTLTAESELEFENVFFTGH